MSWLEGTLLIDVLYLMVKLRGMDMFRQMWGVCLSWSSQKRRFGRQCAVGKNFRPRQETRRRLPEHRVSKMLCNVALAACHAPCEMAEKRA